MNDALLQSAWRAHQTGNLAEAARLYGEILRANPRHFDALYSLAFVYFQTAHYEEAERMMEGALKLNPRSADAYFTRGCALQRLNRTDEALASFDRAISSRPGFAEALINRGAVLMSAQRPVEALQSFDAALNANPGIAEAWNNRGNALSALGRHEEALASYDRVLALKPGIVQTHINRGTALIALKRFGEAQASYDTALRIEPSSLDARAGRANARFETKDYATAAEDYDAILAVDPDYPYARGNLAFSRLHCCDWRFLADDRAAIASALRVGRRVVNPFQGVALLSTAEEQLMCARVYAADKYPAQPDRLWRGEAYRHERLRIAYLSADFNEHAVAKLMTGVFEQHDKTRFETTAISFGGDDTGEGRRRLEPSFDRFIRVDENSDAEVAELLRRMEIDIAVDLMGYTGECRPGIFAFRPAPVQVSYLGFPGTMGASFFDCIIADQTVIPAESRRHYSEAVVYLPDTYVPHDDKRRVAEPLPSRAAAGLPEDGFVFCCFNHSYKFSPQIFEVWMRLLHTTAGSVLWLSQPNDVASRNLRREAAARGVADDRIIFAPFVPDNAGHLARLGLADLFLDTIGYNAHSTAVDALYAGVPVLTLPGGTFAGRVAASAVKAAGLPEMIVESLDAYESTALKLARDASALAAIRGRLYANRSSEPLFDTVRFTRNLEAAYLAMHDKVQSAATS